MNNELSCDSCGACVERQIAELTAELRNARASVWDRLVELGHAQETIKCLKHDRNEAHEYYDMAMVTLLRELGEDGSEPRVKWVSLGIARLKAKLDEARAQCAAVQAWAKSALISNRLLSNRFHSGPQETQGQVCGIGWWVCEICNATATTMGTIVHKDDCMLGTSPGQPILDHMAQLERAIEAMASGILRLSSVPNLAGVVRWRLGDDAFANTPTYNSAAEAALAGLAGLDAMKGSKR